MIVVVVVVVVVAASSVVFVAVVVVVVVVVAVAVVVATRAAGARVADCSTPHPPPRSVTEPEICQSNYQVVVPTQFFSGSQFYRLTGIREWC